LSGRFVKGQSGNPAGRPRSRRPHVSAFDVIFDKTLTITQNGVERELTVDEALQLQTYQAALKGSKMAVRAVLKMIEKREVALTARAPKPAPKPARLGIIYDTDSADQAMRILGIASDDKRTGDGGWWDGRLKLATWATQAAISRPGRKALTDKALEDVKRFTHDADRLKWPKSRRR
jgi:Family of unknown function (DUF5681)